MLKDYRELAKNLKEKFKSIKVWPEIEFTPEDKIQLNKLKGITNVNKHSFQLETGNNHCVIPSQYILYAIVIKELAISIKEFLDVFEKFKKNKSDNDIGILLDREEYDLNNINIDNYSEKIALNIFIDKDYNQGAKKIANKDKDDNNKYKIRGISDFFESIILKIINVPDASSIILGKIIFNLCENIDLYNYLEKRFINQIPYITKEINIGKFVKNVLSFLIQYDSLEVFQSVLIKNRNGNFTSIKDGEISLTSIFKTSSSLLNENDLTMGNKLRFFTKPIYINLSNELVYLSTEWTDGKESRLDLDSFKKLIEKYYPEFDISKEDDIYFLKSKTGVEIKKLNNNDIPFSLIDIQKEFNNAGIQIQDKLINRYICSLLTKPFVILTGLSGSGKTKLAHAFALWICEDENQYCIVPVGSDWNNREPLLGFPNALKTGEYIKPDNKALDLILSANANPDKPYFLILDEMNLSHVERYFSDFLSVMESSSEISLHSGKDDYFSGEEKIPPKIKLPKNFFIIGTVNIDETTYMFSPKVLDRASVIELRVTSNEMKNYLQNPSILKLENLKSGGALMARSFIDISINKSISQIENNNTLQNELLKFFEELKKTGAEFGYRTASEIKHLIIILNQLTKDNTQWDGVDIDRDNDFIDIAIMQKLLPKLHGSRSRLTKVLLTLGSFCIKSPYDIRKDFFELTNEIDFNDRTKVKYPLSLEKIFRMYKGAIDNGFASYAEA